MIDNDEGYPTGADDKGFWAISPCGSCPVCGVEGDMISKDRDEYTGITDADCWSCGYHWYEREFDYDEDDDGVSLR